jgi:hypothetical protein
VILAIINISISSFNGFLHDSQMKMAMANELRSGMMIAKRISEK